MARSRKARSWDPRHRYDPAELRVEDALGTRLLVVRGTRGGSPAGWPLDLATALVAVSVVEGTLLHRHDLASPVDVAEFVRAHCPKYTWTATDAQPGTCRYIYMIRAASEGLTFTAFVGDLVLFAGTAFDYVDVIVAAERGVEDVPDWRQIAEQRGSLHSE